MRSRMFQIVQRARRGDRVSRAYDIFVVFVACASIVPTLFRADALSETWQQVISTIDIVSVYILAFDYILRWLTHDLREGRPRDWKAFVRYPFTFSAIIDLLAILPSLNVLPAGFLFLRALRVFRVFRYSRHLSIIADVFYQERRTLGLILILACLYIFVTSLIMFTLEGDTFTDFVDALYWGTITLTTIGFGDIHPLTDVGRVITSISSLFGIFVLALPAGIMTGSFLKQLQLRDDGRDEYSTSTFVGKLDPRYFLFTPSRVKSFFARNPKVRLYLAAILAGAALDLVLYAIFSELFWQPIWLDTAGTALVACAIDPAAGVIVGFLNNLFIAVYTGNAGSLLYLAQSVVVALVYGLMLPLDKNGKRPMRKSARVLLYTIVIQTAISFCLAMLLSGGTPTTIYAQSYQATLLEWGLPSPAATFGALLGDRILDSIAVFVVVGIFCRIMKNPRRNPRRWLEERGFSTYEDLSEYVNAGKWGEGVAAAAGSGRAADDLDDFWVDDVWRDDGPAKAKLASAAAVLEARAADAGDPSEAERYKAAATALRIAQNDDVASSGEFARLFDALEFGRLGDDSSRDKPHDNFRDKPHDNPHDNPHV